MVLRAIPTLGEKHFKVIGPAYAHGMMYGECFVDAEQKKDALILVWNIGDTMYSEARDYFHTWKLSDFMFDLHTSTVLA